MLGVSEGIGFIQIGKKDLSDIEMRFNTALALVYTFARSMKGVVLLIVYICKEDVFHLYREVVRNVVNPSVTANGREEVELETR